jgi:hypothetical protein
VEQPGARQIRCAAVRSLDDHARLAAVVAPVDAAFAGALAVIA